MRSLFTVLPTIFVIVECSIYMQLNNNLKHVSATFGSEVSLSWIVLDDAGESAENFTMAFYFLGDGITGRRVLFCEYASDRLQGVCNGDISDNVIRFERLTSYQYGFTISQVNSMNTGYYECDHRSSSSTAAERLYLNITGIPPAPTIVPESAPRISETTNLTCVPGTDNRSEDRLPLTITWFIDGRYIDPRNAPRRYVINGSHLYITDTNEEDKDKSFTCVIQEPSSQIFGPSAPYVINFIGGYITSTVFGVFCCAVVILSVILSSWQLKAHGRCRKLSINRSEPSICPSGFSRRMRAKTDANEVIEYQTDGNDAIISTGNVQDYLDHRVTSGCAEAVHVTKREHRRSKTRRGAVDAETQCPSGLDIPMATDPRDEYIDMSGRHTQAGIPEAPTVRVYRNQAIPNASAPNVYESPERTVAPEERLYETLGRVSSSL